MSDIPNPPELGSIPLFADVPAAALAPLEALALRRDLDDGQMIMHEGDVESPVLFVLSGHIRAFHINPDGREQTLHLLGPGSAVNLPVAFDQDVVAPASAVAVGATQVLVFPRGGFRKAVSEAPEVALAVLGDLSSKLRHLTALAHDLSLRSVRARLARFLLEKADSPADIPVRWTHEAIAAQIGSVREVVSRAMRALVKEGLVRMERQRVVVVKREALERIAEE